MEEHKKTLIFGWTVVVFMLGSLCGFGWGKYRIERWYESHQEQKKPAEVFTVDAADRCFATVNALVESAHVERRIMSWQDDCLRVSEPVAKVKQCVYRKKEIEILLEARDQKWDSR
jgi:hypothetical protein